MLLPHKQLSSASSSTASWVTSYFENSPSFLPHSFWMEVFARGFPALVSSFLHSSAFSVVPAQLLALKSGSLKYQQKRKVFYSLFWFCFVLTQTRIEICFPVPAQLVEQCSAAEEQQKMPRWTVWMGSTALAGSITSSSPTPGEGSWTLTVTPWEVFSDGRPQQMRARGN